MLYPSQANQWREMASSGKMTKDDKQVELNKEQRYLCIKMLAKWGQDYEDLLDSEFAREFSADDELAKLRVSAAKLTRANKQELWDSYLVKDQWKQSDFIQSAYNLLNRHQREDCEHFAELFFRDVERVEQEFHRDYFRDWFDSLCPDYLKR